MAKLSLAVAVSGLLVAGLALPAIGGLGIAARNSLQTFEESPCDIDVQTPPQKSVVYAADRKTIIATLFSANGNREIVPFKSIPEVARKAIVAIEDRRFYQHHGVDVQGLLRALVENSRSGTVVQGGSTLTAQYVKQVRLYQAKTVAERDAATEDTTGRKLLEARCALTLEKKYSKDEILARYLNIAYFGAGANGIGIAARTYFGRPVSKVTLDQAALLAGLVQSPVRYDPYQHPKAAVSRRNTVLDEMQSLGYITAKQATQAKAAPLKLTPRTTASRDCANANRAIPNAGYFCDYAKAYLDSIGYPQGKLETGGYKIYTTLDVSTQKRVQAAVFKDMPADRRAASVMDVLDTKTGKVRAMAVSKHYGVKKGDRKITSVGLGYKPVAGAGSTYKLFTLIAALERKIPLEAFTIQNTNEYKPTNCPQARGKKDGVVNAGSYARKPYNLDEATYASVNTFFVALIDQQFDCDLSTPVRAALKMGLNSLKPHAETIVNGQQYSFTLGPQPTSPLELASAYATVANDGKYCPPTPIEKIVGPDGKTAALPERNCTQQIEPGIARTVSQVLVKDTKPGFSGTANGKFGSYYSAGGSDVAGKTGTASAGDTGLNGSAWFVGYTPDITASVATFNPDSSSAPLQDVPGFENDGGEIFGSFSSTIWRDGLQAILLAKPRWEFLPADPEVVNGNSVPVPPVVGMDIGTATSTLAQAGFGINVATDRKDAALPPDRIAEQSPSGRGLPGQEITVYLSSGHPPAGPRGPGQQPNPGQQVCDRFPQLPGCSGNGGGNGGGGGGNGGGGGGGGNGGG